MHALFFEMTPKPGHLDHYFDHVARLQPALARHTGLVFLDRYGAREAQNRLLSHQLWQSEADIVAWRRDPEHRRSQVAGYSTHFADYRIRVGERIDHQSQDAGARRTQGNPVSEPPYVVAVYGTTPPAAPQFAVFESFKRQGQFLALADFATRDAAQTCLERQSDCAGVQEVSIYAITRDYGLFDRAQAPQ